MTFKMVTDSEKAAGRIAGTASTHAVKIAGEQTERWRDRLPEGQTVIDVEQLQRFHADDLRRLRQELRDAEAAHLALLEEIRQARERRDAAVPRVRERLYAMRDLFQGVYGEKGPRALFLEKKPRVPADATPLRRVARLVAGKLRAPDLELPAAILKGTELSRATLAGEIEEPLAELETAMQELEDLLPRASETLEAKRRAHAAVDLKSARLARFLEGLYELEGHDVLAAKVRPSSHRRRDAEDRGEAEVEASREEAGVDDAREATVRVPKGVAQPTAPERREAEPGVDAGERWAPRDPTADRRDPRPVVKRQRIRSRVLQAVGDRRSSPVPVAGGES